mgnify:CR=1 FL=1
MTVGISSAAFASLMRSCVSWGVNPRLAVAVSGGADSLTLAFLAHEWARAQGGEAVALTVDHGLREASAREAVAVGEWLGAEGMRHHVLKWKGPHPKTRIQEAARVARYDLLARWCRANQIMFLLLAHHRDDQAETYLMRKERGSRPTGLAAMRAVTPPPGGGHRWPLLVRPLLPLGKNCLEATLASRGQDWIRDPSNENTGYTRVQVRRHIMGTPEPDAFTDRLVQQAEENAKIRDRANTDINSLYARFLTLSPYGYARIRVWDDIPEALSRGFWSRLLRTVGGRPYPPRIDRVETFMAKLEKHDFKATTVAGCYIQRTQNGLLIMREQAGIVKEAAIIPEMVWDRRFLIHSDLSGDYQVRPLGEEGVRALKTDWPETSQLPLPAMVHRTLPGIFRNGVLQGMPVFGCALADTAGLKGVCARFVPPVPLGW